MLTKTLKFDTEVLDILRGMEWNADGTIGELTCGNLSARPGGRKLYEAVDKALSVMGGKWNRSAKAHVFQTDPRQSVDGLLESGSLTVERDGFFETPEAVVERMLALVPLPTKYQCRVLEPSAGLGAILRVLVAHDAHQMYYAVEKNEKRAARLREDFPSVSVACGDFLDSTTGIYFDRVYMNPPFEESQDIDHVRRACDFLLGNGGLVSVMSESPFFRSDTKAVNFRIWLEGMGGESHELPEGSFKASGTGVKTRLVVIRK